MEECQYFKQRCTHAQEYLPELLMHVMNSGITCTFMHSASGSGWQSLLGKEVGLTTKELVAISSHINHEVILYSEV